MAQLFVTKAIWLQRVAKLLAQAAKQHVGLLGNEQQISLAGPLHPTSGRRPQTTDHAQERGFAAARWAHNQQTLMKIHLNTEVADQDAIGAGRHQIDMANQDRISTATGARGGQLGFKRCSFNAD